MNKPIDTQIVEKEILSKITHFLPSHFKNLSNTKNIKSTNNISKDSILINQFISIIHENKVLNDFVWDKFYRNTRKFSNKDFPEPQKAEFDLASKYLRELISENRFNDNQIIEEGESGRIYYALRWLVLHFGYEAHPYLPFVPKKPTTLILGSFPGRQFTQDLASDVERPDWFYGNPTNKFWPLLSEALNSTKLESKNQKQEKQELLASNHIAIYDIIGIARSKNNGAKDIDLIVLGYNHYTIDKILNEHQSINKILFTGKWVAEQFYRHILPNIYLARKINYITLLSPAQSFYIKTYAEKLESFKQGLGVNR